jgi:response regulator of citrate/malate metabolism
VLLLPAPNPESSDSRFRMLTSSYLEEQHATRIESNVSQRGIDKLCHALKMLFNRRHIHLLSGFCSFDKTFSTTRHCLHSSKEELSTMATADHSRKQTTKSVMSTHSCVSSDARVT